MLGQVSERKHLPTLREFLDPVVEDMDPENCIEDEFRVRPLEAHPCTSLGYTHMSWSSKTVVHVGNTHEFLLTHCIVPAARSESTTRCTSGRRCA